MSRQENRFTEKVLRGYPRRDNGRFYLGTGLACVLIALFILIGACFAALTYYTANQKMAAAEKTQASCDKYYAAETTASELLSGIAKGSADPVSTKGSKSTYDTAAGKVEVTKVKEHVTFAVPAGKKQELKVEAKVKDKEVQILVWTLQ